MSETLTFEGSAGRPVRADLHAAGEDAPTVIVCHGFKGFRAWGFFPWLCERVRECGLNALRIDFSHNGVERTDFDRLDLFLLDTWTRHQDDLAGVTDLLAGPLYIVGHSRGGADAILHAAANPRIERVVTLAAVADATRAPPDAEEKLRELGYYPFPNVRTKQVMPVSRHQLEDGRNHDVPAAARAIADRPLLLIHGDADESVPVSDARVLADAHGGAETMILEDAGHTFGAGHPFAGPTPALRRAVDRLTEFLSREVG